MQDQVLKTREMLQQIDFAAVAKVVERLHDAYLTGKRVFIFGNGGSAATSSHLAEDLAKSTVKDMTVPRRLRVQSLTDCVPFITALGNDWGYEYIFREQLVTVASSGDIAIGISGSGNSPNVLRAIEWANANGLFTCGLTGFSGGKLMQAAQVVIHSAVHDMEVAENCHMIEAHLLVSGLRAKVAGLA